MEYYIESYTFRHADCYEEHVAAINADEIVMRSGYHRRSVLRRQDSPLLVKEIVAK